MDMHHPSDLRFIVHQTNVHCIHKYQHGAIIEEYSFKSSAMRRFNAIWNKTKHPQH